MTNDGLNTLVYDGENRATSATNGGSSGAYTYDGGGLRVKKVAGSTTTVYVFSGSKVAAEYDNGAAPTSPSREYIYSGTTLIAKIDSTGTHYYHKDLLSNRLVTDSSGNVSAQLGHYPYGESWYNGSSDKLLFTSYERDAESGNDYAQARYYVSRLGRFSSVDPLSGSTGDPQSLNRYSYVRDLPTLLADPSGTCGELIESRRRKRRIEMEPSGMALHFYEVEEMYPDPGQDVAEDPCSLGGGNSGGDGGGEGSTGSDAHNCGTDRICVTAPGTPYPPDPPPQPPVTDPCDEDPSFCTLGPPQVANNAIVNSKIWGALTKLQKVLALDQKCLDFLNKHAPKGTNALTTLQAIIDVGAYGQDLLPATFDSNGSPTSITNAWSGPSGLDPQAAITVNSVGAFFSGKFMGVPTTTDNKNIGGGTPAAQNFVLLHELAHVTGALAPDFNNSAAGEQNNTLLEQNCKKTIKAGGSK